MMGARVSWIRRAAASWLCATLLVACGGQAASSGPGLSYKSMSASVETDPLATYSLKGDVSPIRDPSIIKSGATHYLFTTDVVGLPLGPSLPIRCSKDELNWSRCGSVFESMPAWVRTAVPGVVGLWAPDVTYWGGLYRVYYSGSTLNSQRSVIGVATNVTLDPTDPRYKWVDQGEVLESRVGDDFNAIDPNILLDSDGRIWMTYGSYWSGIKQIEIDRGTGGVLAGAIRHDLATRPGVVNNPIEGASMAKHNGFYYLFISVDYCCNRDPSANNYKEAVGRSTSPQGPFVDAAGTPMMVGGGSVLLDHDTGWNAAGGGTAYTDPETGDSLLAFHAVKLSDNAAYGWLKHISWQNDWPVLQ
jgi:arabinan endo-1,5-alpha-L-arabinosidase